ncbi:hypothetical protein JM79_2735 [Gramella sp. Hel_I_59]|uniref:hypothetical protein n=1 Tax=Gramella sp. Hel_I_59 TaxID=1249978 RepID=UPI00114FB682|nr:hypothetical protein [Gramella sp. Hel_I_59]TQI71786.1 hypothetical protein JM79_2735 [Gramella sp. Hel_I_59]
MIYFFIKDNTCDRWHDLELSAWLEHENVLYTDTNEHASSFDRIEHLKIHVSKGGNFESVTLKADFGKNGCTGSSARSPEELIKKETDNASWSGLGSTQVNKKEYLELREHLMDIYKKKMCLDFDTIKSKSETDLTSKI